MALVKISILIQVVYILLFFLRLKMDDKIYRIPVKRLGGARETFSFKGIIDFIN